MVSLRSPAFSSQLYSWLASQRSTYDFILSIQYVAVEFYLPGLWSTGRFSCKKLYKAGPLKVWSLTEIAEYVHL